MKRFGKSLLLGLVVFVVFGFGFSCKEAGKGEEDGGKGDGNKTTWTVIFKDSFGLNEDVTVEVEEILDGRGILDVPMKPSEGWKVKDGFRIAGWVDSAKIGTEEEQKLRSGEYDGNYEENGDMIEVSGDLTLYAVYKKGGMLHSDNRLGGQQCFRK